MQWARSQLLIIPILLVASLALVACQTPPSQSGQAFVAAATALAQAESDYFDEIQAASDASYRIRHAFAYADHRLAWQDLAPRLGQSDDFSKAKALRMAAMAQLSDYSQQIAAIIAASSDPGIATAAQTDAGNLIKLGQDAGALKISASQLTLVQTAVKEIAQAIVANQTANQLQSLAQQASKPIADISRMVQDDKGLIEDTSFAEGLAGDQSAAMIAVLSAVYADRRVNSADRLIVYDRYTLSWKPTLVTKGAAIAASMKKLQDANDAMKTSQHNAATVWLQQAYQLAQLALATQPQKK